MSETATVDLTELKQPQVKELLEERGIDFPRGPVSNAKLIELLEQDSTSWPSKGFDGEQPWADRENPSITIVHDKPILASGSAGAEVLELCSLLAELGYETDVMRGENAFCVLGSAEMQAVQRFRTDYGVLEDPTGFGGGEGPDEQRLAAAHVGPWTWEALLRATGRVS